MSDIVVRVENLSKKYIIGHQQRESDTLRDVISHSAKNLLHRFQRDRSKFVNSSTEEFWALKDVSFEIKQGDRVGIIGRNGAGKSTLLKILSRITEPTSGSIRIKGRVSSLLEVGTGFHPELTGRENIFLNGAVLGMKKTEVQQKFDEIVAFSEVEKFLDTPVKRYSSGMYVRLAFAVAAHLEPEVLIIDEVLAVGDIEFQKKCLGKMEDVGKEGRTVIFVSHNTGAVLSLCTSAFLLQSGKLLFEGSAQQTISNYLKLGNTLKNSAFFLIDKGDRSAHLQSIEIIDIDRHQSEILITGKPFGIKINFSTLALNKNPQPCFLISSENGIKLFQSINTNNYKTPNTYSSIAWFNPNILNDGRYILTVAITTSNPTEVHVSIDIPLEVIDNPHDEVRGDYQGQMHGYLRPKIHWE
jgi:lipopolysaccharide transport system ATP-binding protein